MGIARGTNIITDGLVFGYDTGVGVADKDTKTRFYAGKPSSNLLQNTTALDNTSSWARSRNSGSAPTVTANTSPNPLGGKYPGMADKVYIPDDGTYPRIAQSFTPASTNTHTFSIWIRSLSGSCGIFLGIFRNSPWSLPGHTTIADDQITDVWKRFSFSFTPADTSSHQIYMGAHDAAAHKGNTLEFWGAQIEEESDRTPFMDAITTASSLRAASGGEGGSLIDLKRSRNISLVNMSFNSAQQPTFDGTNDYIYIDSSILNVSSFTVEAIVNITSSGNYNKPIFVCGNLSSTGIWFLKHRSGLGNRLVMHGYDGVNPRVDVQSTNVVPDAENTYVAVTFNGTSYQLYINGVADGNSVSDNAPASSNDNYIGRQGNTGTYLLGDIPVLKVYNSALTATEVTQNYNAYKNRFNI